MRIFLSLCCVVALGASALPLIHPAWLISDWLEQGRLQIIYGCIICSVIALWKQQKLSCAILMVIALINGGWIMQHISTATYPSTSNPPRLRVMTMNVWKDNPDLPSAIKVIRAVNPDIIWLQEVSRDMLTQICTALKSSYPYPHCPAGHKGFYGMGFLSKQPFVQKWEDTYIYDAETSIFHVSFSAPHDDKDFIGVYFRSPRDNDRLAVRTQQMHNVSEHLATYPAKNFIIAGDMNSVFWQSNLHQMRSMSGLRHAQHSAFQTPLTWNTAFPMPLRIPIDHIMISNALCSYGIDAAPATGSDHNAIYADIATCNSATLKSQSHISD